jgi:hypothetical protein
MVKIDAKHKRLADRYLLHLNAARAAREVGYAQVGARARASEILARPEVRAYVNAQNDVLNAEVQLGGRHTREELAIIAFSSIKDFVVTRSGKVALAPGVPDETWHAVKSIEFVAVKGKIFPKIRLWPKEAALRMVGEHLGMFKQVIETRDRTLEDALDALDDAENKAVAVSGNADRE